MTVLGMIIATGFVVANTCQAEQHKMNGKLKVATMSPEEIRYTGKPYSRELGAYVFNMRDYDPVTSRWTTADPKGFPDGVNNRLYTNNISTYVVDQMGTDIYYCNGTGGDHSSITITDPNSPTGYTWFSYAPATGTGYNDICNVYTQGKLYTQPSAPNATDLRIPTTPEQDAAALAFAASIVKNPGMYNFCLHNCSDVAEQIINAALPADKQLFIPVFDTPCNLNNQILLYLGLPLE